MKFRVISDLHVEFYASPVYLQRKLDLMYPSVEDDEILIVAGDLGVAGSGISYLSINPEYKAMLEYFAKKWNYVVLVPGNHEYYDRDRLCSLNDVDNMIRKNCDALGIVFLNKDSVILDLDKKKSKEKKSVHLLGCTLWSKATPQAYKGMNDRLKAILSHKELIDTHNEHKEWLEEELKLLSKKKKQEVIVVTHHLPLQDLTHPKYLEERFKPLNSAYASNLDDFIIQFKNSVEKPSSMVEKPKSKESKIDSIEGSGSKIDSIEKFLEDQERKNPPEESNLIKKWFCGHTHEKTEKELYGISFLINPLGYPRESKVTKTKTELILH